IERRYVDGGIDQVRVAARELAALNPDAIVSTCSDSTAAAKEETAPSGIPVVMAFVSDPVGQGLIASYQRPVGNITGLSSQADDNLTYNARVQLIELVKKQRIPTIFGAREFVDIGGLMSYGPDLASSYRHTAVYVDKVLTGTKPANLPVEQPTHFEFVVNLAAA